jgi:hypothetical protein
MEYILLAIMYNVRSIIEAYQLARLTVPYQMANHLESPSGDIKTSDEMKNIPTHTL